MTEKELDRYFKTHRIAVTTARQIPGWLSGAVLLVVVAWAVYYGVRYDW